jgi:hypothetical protein
MPKTRQHQGRKQNPKQPTIKRQKRHNGRDGSYTVIDGQRIYLGVYDSPESEKEYRRVVAEYNAGFITPKQASTDVTIAELVLRFLKEREGKVSVIQWEHEQRVATVLVSQYGDRDTATFDINCLRAVRNVFIEQGYVRQKIEDKVVETDRFTDGNRYQPSLLYNMKRDC